MCLWLGLLSPAVAKVSFMVSIVSPPWVQGDSFDIVGGGAALMAPLKAEVCRFLWCNRQAVIAGG